MKISFKKIIILIIVLGITAILSVFLLNYHVKRTAARYIVSSKNIPEDESYDCIFVLGCGVSDDGVPSHMLEDRLRRAVELYHAGVAPKIIMSGDHGRKNYDEVNTMRDYAIAKGVPEEDIFMDHAGFSTYESMYRAKEIFCVKSMVIITQEYHLYRAVYIANNLGIKSTGVDCDYREYYGQKMRDIREIAARCKDFFTCIFKPLPTYIGETIPVSGDGRATLG